MTETRHDAYTRRDCLKHIAVGGAAAALVGTTPALAKPAGKTRHVLAFSDIHIGRKDDGLDGAEWLARAFKEIKQNKLPVDYAMALGDIAHGASEDAFKTYKKLRDDSGIKTWFELAGNHEYHKGTSKNYESILRPVKPHSHTDGNIVWFFISDEKPGVAGNISDKTYAWLKKAVAENQDKIVIVCSHQLVDGTIRKSESAQRHIHPKEKIAELLKDYKVDLWLCGHEHHRPYSTGEIARKNGTTFINIASMSHAYGSKQSQSFVFGFKDGAKQITARRRVHDDQAFDKKYETVIPLRSAIKLPGK